MVLCAKNFSEVAEKVKKHNPNLFLLQSKWIIFRLKERICSYFKGFGPIFYFPT